MPLHLLKCYPVILATLFFFAPTASADQPAPDLASHWHALVPMYPDDPRVRTLQNMNADLFVGDRQQTHLALDADNAAYWMGNLHAGPMRERRQQVLLVKYDKQGKRLWHRLLAEPETHYNGSSVATDERGNLYVSGTRTQRDRNQSTTHGFIASFSTKGEPRWFYELPHADRAAASACRGIAIQGRRLFFTGNARGRVANNAQPGQVGRISSMTDGLVGCLRTDGRLAWMTQIQDTKNQSFSAWEVAVLSNDRIAVAVNEMTDLGGGTSRTSAAVYGFNNKGKQLWRTVLGEDLLPPDADANAVPSAIWSIASDGSDKLYALAGHDLRGVSEHHGLYLARLSATGQTQWQRHLPTDEQIKDNPSPLGRLAVDTSGNAWVPTTIEGGQGRQIPVLMRYNPAGELQSARQLANNRQYNAFHTLAVSSTDRLVATGQFFPAQFATSREQPGILQAEHPPHFFLAHLNLDAAQELLEP